MQPHRRCPARSFFQGGGAACFHWERMPAPPTCCGATCRPWSPCASWPPSSCEPAPGEGCVVSMAGRVARLLCFVLCPFCCRGSPLQRLRHRLLECVHAVHAGSSLERLHLLRPLPALCDVSWAACAQRATGRTVGCQRPGTVSLPRRARRLRPAPCAGSSVQGTAKQTGWAAAAATRRRRRRSAAGWRGGRQLHQILRKQRRRRWGTCLPWRRRCRRGCMHAALPARHTALHFVFFQVAVYQCKCLSCCCISWGGQQTVLLTAAQTANGVTHPSLQQQKQGSQLLHGKQTSRHHHRAGAWAAAPAAPPLAPPPPAPAAPVAARVASVGCPDAGLAASSAPPSLAAARLLKQTWRRGWWRCSAPANAHAGGRKAGHQAMASGGERQRQRWRRRAGGFGGVAGTAGLRLITAPSPSPRQALLSGTPHPPRAGRSRRRPSSVRCAEAPNGGAQVLLITLQWCRSLRSPGRHRRHAWMGRRRPCWRQ